jgi:hypothetical protein
MPRAKTFTNRAPRFFITIEVEEQVKTQFEDVRKEKGLKRTSDFGRMLIKNAIRQHHQG